jgi:hypothetical protein
MPLAPVPVVALWHVVYSACARHEYAMEAIPHLDPAIGAQVQPLPRRIGREKRAGR